MNSKCICMDLKIFFVSQSNNFSKYFNISGEYSCLKVDLLFKREFSYYLIQIYIPCCMLVIVSWVSFWLDPNAIPARVSLGVTTLLTMATQISGINASLPPVSYTKVSGLYNLYLIEIPSKAFSFKYLENFLNILRLQNTNIVLHICKEKPLIIKI